MQKRRLGHDGPSCSAIGLGCMGMSGAYGPSDRGESIATLLAAAEAGVTLLDTGDFYGMGHNEVLIGEACRQLPRDQLQISVKFGALRGPAGDMLGFDTRPHTLKNALAQTLSKLGTDYIDIYRPARLDPAVPIEDTVGAIADMVHAGYVRAIGLSEVGSDTIARAHAVHPICDVQLEYSLLSRGIEDAVLPTCRTLGIGITAYGVLSRGLISGHWQPGALTAGDGRMRIPRFQPGNVEQNLRLADALQPIAAARGATVAQLAIAWVLSRGNDIVPVVGARRRDRLREALGAAELTLDAETLAAIEQAVPKGAAAGPRAALAQLKDLDSEKG